METLKDLLKLNNYDYTTISITNKYSLYIEMRNEDFVITHDTNECKHLFIELNDRLGFINIPLQNEFYDKILNKTLDNYITLDTPINELKEYVIELLINYYVDMEI